MPTEPQFSTLMVRSARILDLFQHFKYTSARGKHYFLGPEFENTENLRSRRNRINSGYFSFYQSELIGQRS